MFGDSTIYENLHNMKEMIYNTLEYQNNMEKIPLMGMNSVAGSNLPLCSSKHKSPHFLEKHVTSEKLD